MIGSMIDNREIRTCDFTNVEKADELFAMVKQFRSFRFPLG